MSASLQKRPRQPRATARQRRIREAYAAAMASQRAAPSTDINDIIEAVLRVFPGVVATWRDLGGTAAEDPENAIAGAEAPR